jgi:hypothetical protein
MILIYTDAFISHQESRKPRIPMAICDRTFDLVTEHLKALHYDGPVCLSCDDTKLLSSLILYWDGEKKAHFLVGAVGGLIEVPDPNNIKGLMSDPKIVKAMKVFVFQIFDNRFLILHAGLAMVFTGTSAKSYAHYSGCLADS